MPARQVVRNESTCVRLAQNATTDVLHQVPQWCLISCSHQAQHTSVSESPPPFRAPSHSLLISRSIPIYVNMTTIGQLLNLAVTNAATPADTSDAKTSRKPWTEQFAIAGISLQSNLLGQFHATENFGPLDDADAVRLNVQMTLPKPTELVVSGTEVTAHYHKYVDSVVRPAWSSFPYLAFRYGMGPPWLRDVAATMTVDVMMQMGNRAAVIGEWKKPGVINAAVWTEGTKALNKDAKSLARELLGYGDIRLTF